MQVILQKANCFSFLLKRMQKQFLLLLILSAGVATNSFAQPGNDEPCNAIPLLPDLVCNSQTFDNTGASISVGMPLPGGTCAPVAATPGDDVWFQVVVPAASNGNLTIHTEELGITDAVMNVYSGTCNNLQFVSCDDDTGPGAMPLIFLNGLTVGSTIWIRIYSYNNNQHGTFGICVTYPGPPPANDEPCTATALPDPNTTCTYQNFSNETATGTLGVPNPGCANYQGNDVWFTVTVPAGGLLKFDTQTGVMTDGGMAIYSGTCSNLTLIACDDNSSPNGLMPQIIQTGLTPGATIWIRVWGNGNAGANNGTFGICVSIPPAPPVNDNPCNAILLTANSTCQYQTFTNESASSSPGVPDPGCAQYQGGDVWFKVVVPCDGKLTLDTQTGVITDGGMAAYSGTCDNLQLIACDDDLSPNGLMPILNLTGLAPGSTIFVRVWEYQNDNNGTFGICASIPPPPTTGSNCLGAQSFCSSNTYTYANSTNVPSLGGGGIYGCLGSTPNPAWYYFQVSNPGDISILIQQTNTAGTIVDVDYALWGPFPNLAASCGNLAATNIVSCSYSTSGTETAVLTNAQAGDVYVLLITNFSNQAGTVTFNQSSGAGSTNCNIVCTLTAGNSGPACACGTVNLTASTVVGATYQWTGPNCFNQTPGSNQQNPTNVPVPCIPGTYIYTVTATTPPPTGSTCFAQTTVVVNAAPTIGVDTTVYICPGGTKDLTAVYSTLTGLTPEWTTYPAGTPVADPTAVTDAGVYQVTGTNSNGCKDTALVTVTTDQVTFDVTATALANCTLPGEITVTNPLGVGNEFTYNIETYPGVFQPSNIFVAEAGPHVIITRDSIGCEASMPITVDFTNDLTVDATPATTTICSGQSANLTATSNNASSTYAWLPTTGLNDASSATPVASPTTSTVYTVTATVGPCTQTGTISVVVDSDLSVEAGGPLNINAGSSQQEIATVTGTNTSLSAILWTPSAGLSSTTVLNPLVTPVITTGSTTYQITVTNTNGCTATDELVVNVQSDNVSKCINVRNAFTPNGDGINDLWFVYDESDCFTFGSVHALVYNRYGSKVFEAKDYRNTWNGNYKNQVLPDGTYYAVVEFKLLNGRILTIKRDLTILR